MAEYRPNIPFSTPCVLLIPSYETIAGVRKKTFPAIKDGIVFFSSFKTYGGTERVQDGLYSIIDTAEVVTWYNPQIKSDCLVVLADTEEKFEIMNEPENINRRNQFMKFKVKRIKGGA